MSEYKKITHQVRINGNESDGLITIEKYSRKLAVHIMCSECLGYEINPSKCTCVHCPLYPFRKRSNKAFDKKLIEK
jgi:hypothetical protein